MAGVDECLLLDADVTSLMGAEAGALSRDIHARGRVSRMLRRPDEKRSMTDGLEPVWCSSRSRERVGGVVGSATVTRCGDFVLASPRLGRSKPADDDEVA